MGLHEDARRAHEAHLDAQRDASTARVQQHQSWAREQQNLLVEFVDAMRKLSIAPFQYPGVYPNPDSRRRPREEFTYTSERLTGWALPKSYKTHRLEPETVVTPEARLYHTLVQSRRDRLLPVVLPQLGHSEGVEFDVLSGRLRDGVLQIMREGLAPPPDIVRGWFR